MSNTIPSPNSPPKNIVLRNIRAQNFKTFRELDLPVGNINLVIGANGAGKSNLLQIFHLLNTAARQQLQRFIAQSGGPTPWLSRDAQDNPRINLEFHFEDRASRIISYHLTLAPIHPKSKFGDATLAIVSEQYQCNSTSQGQPQRFAKAAHTPHDEAALPNWAKSGDEVAQRLLQVAQSSHIYHFHDTSGLARIRHPSSLNDNHFLRPDGSNLAAYLYQLRESFPAHYHNIIESTKIIMPSFGDFVLRPPPKQPDHIRLEWREQNSDMVFGAHALSDGVLRFICLATLFLQPPETMPPIIIVDEPELGLHPVAITVLAELIRAAAADTRIFLATQSALLLDRFNADEVIVVNRMGNQSHAHRLNANALAPWLEEHPLSQLWEMNVIGGTPVL